MVGAVVALGTMREACADWSMLAPKPSEFGGFTSRPAVGRNEDGRLEVFMRGINPAYPLHHIWQLTGGGWSHTNNLGGSLTSNIAVSNNLDGRLEVFVYGTDNALYHRWQNTPNGDWDPYSGLGGSLKGDPTVVQNGDGRLEVFARGSDNILYNRWQVAPNSSWSNWSRIGDQATSNVAAIMHYGSVALNIFWRGTNGRLQWKRQATQNGPWEATRSLGGPISVGDPVVAEFDGQRSDPKLVVFVRGNDGAIWYRHQTAPNSTTWSNWISLGGTWKGNVSVGRNWDGRLDLWVRAPNNFVYHTFQRDTDSTASWNGWALFGGILDSDVGVGMNTDGRLEIFGIGTDGALWHRWQIIPGGAWS
jgi:hypothetical protein